MPIKVVFFDCDGTLTKTKSSWEYLHRRLNLWTKNADAYQAFFRKEKLITKSSAGGMLFSGGACLFPGLTK